MIAEGERSQMKSALKRDETLGKNADGRKQGLEGRRGSQSIVGTLADWFAFRRKGLEAFVQRRLQREIVAIDTFGAE